MKLYSIWWRDGKGRGKEEWVRGKERQNLIKKRKRLDKGGRYKRKLWWKRELSLPSMSYRVVYSSLDLAIGHSCWTGCPALLPWFWATTGCPRWRMIHLLHWPSLKDLYDLCSPGPHWRLWFTILGCGETIGSHGCMWSSSSWEPCWYLWPNLPPKAILEFKLLKTSISRSILLQPGSVFMFVVHLTY